MWSPDLSCLTINGEQEIRRSPMEEISPKNQLGCDKRLKFSNLKRKSASEEVTGKRRKLASQTRTLLKRSLSFGDSPLNNDNEIDKLFLEETYIADGSRHYRLPLVAGQHRDLKSITPDTVKDLLDGQLRDVVNSFKIIDCRYPYEYNGGHIKGAENLYTEDQIHDFLINTTNGNKQCDIIIFHCEFSSKRGPKMLRHLRQKDREINRTEYPKLNYPEIYLLEGGYKSFYNSDRSRSLCEPPSYVPMLHENHQVDVRHFRSKTSRSKRTCSREMKRVVAPQKRLFPIC